MAFASLESWYTLEFMIVRISCLHVVAVLDEVLGQRGEQFLVRRRIGRAQVVHRIHQAAAHEVAPRRD